MHYFHEESPESKKAEDASKKCSVLVCNIKLKNSFFFILKILPRRNDFQNLWGYVSENISFQYFYDRCNFFFVIVWLWRTIWGFFC